MTAETDDSPQLIRPFAERITYRKNEKGFWRFGVYASMLKYVIGFLLTCHSIETLAAITLVTWNVGEISA